MEKKLSIAVISDLHCHHSSSEIDDTYLTTDLLRSDVKNHPVESLIRTIKKDEIEVDLTLCAGDLTNKSDVQGFISGWDFTLEINKELSGNEVIATLGNHDVDSYETFTTYSLEIAKGIKKDFPLKDDDDRDKFWSKGCVFVEGSTYRILVINSSHYHYNKIEAASGKVGDDLINYIQEYLEDKNDNKISIVLAHHHPIDHSRSDLGEDDKIVNGDKLLEALAPFKFDLFIHGHKHDPLLRYHTFHGSNGRIPILSSGSFSAKSNLGWTSRRNTFHKIDIVKNGEQCNGKITTWTFIPRNGWKIMNDDEGFHPYTGFGYQGSIEGLFKIISEQVGETSCKKWSEILEIIPEVEHLIPTEADELYETLRENRLILDKKLSEQPEYISNTKNL